MVATVAVYSPSAPAPTSVMVTDSPTEKPEPGVPMVTPPEISPPTVSTVPAAVPPLDPEMLTATPVASA